MAAPVAYNLAPLAQLLGVGAILALGPLLWLAWHHRGAGAQRRLHALTVLTLFLTFDLVLFGAFTRLTDSGLGCPDWPGCYGHASPLGAVQHIEQAQQTLPDGPVTHGKAWVEMVHRYLATAVGGLILARLVLVLWQRRGRARWPEARRDEHPATAWGLPLVTLLWVCLQGAFGALTVTMKLFPAIVTLHLAGGLVLIGLLAWQVGRVPVPGGHGPVSMPAAVRRAAWACLLLLSAQVLLGGWVSTNYAVLACAEFPLCQGGWWPEMDFAQGFELWRPLGLQADGNALAFAALTAIHMAHRLGAGVVVLALGALAWRLGRVRGMRSAAWALGGLLALQVGTGLSNVVLGWPLAAAVAHTGGAAALVGVLCWTLAASRFSSTVFSVSCSVPVQSRLSA